MREKEKDLGAHELSDLGASLLRAHPSAGGKTEPLPTREQLLYTINKLENVYDFECEGGPLKSCADWQGLKALVIGSATPVSEGTCSNNAQERSAKEQLQPVAVEDRATVEQARETLGRRITSAMALAATDKKLGDDEGQWERDIEAPIAEALAAFESAVRAHAHQGWQEEKDHSAELIGQPIPDTEETEPRLNNVCAAWAANRKNCDEFNAVVRASAANLARAEAAEAALHQGWQEIASAPKDGTRVLVYDLNWCATGPRQTVSSYQPHVPYRPTEYCFSGVSLAAYWMPLPSPPVGGREREGKE